MPARRVPVWREVEAREERTLTNRPRDRGRHARTRLPLRAHRYRPVYDVDGPRVRLGLLWFAVELAAIASGRLGVGVLLAATAGVAALQTARAWRVRGARPHRAAAGACAAAIGISGVVSPPVAGAAILVTVAVALFLSSARAARDPRANPVVDASFTVRCALFAGFAAASVSLAAHLEFGAAVGLLFVVGAYETGDYLVGSGAASPFEGPVAGATAIVVVTFALTALGIKPFELPGSFGYAALAALLCPAGQLTASAVLPSADAAASALRRLDSLLLLAPVWALVVSLST